MLRGSQRLTGGAWGSQTGVTEIAWRRLWALRGLPGEALGPAWATPKSHFGVKVDPKLQYFASNFFEAAFWTFYSSLSCFVVFSNLKDIG